MYSSRIKAIALNSVARMAPAVTVGPFSPSGLIGGPGVEVQIDKSAFGKWKYNHGRVVETKWVLGGVKIRPDANGHKQAGDVFLLVVPNRTRRTLHAVISKYVRRGSHIVTDKWVGNVLEIYKTQYTDIF